MRSSRIEYYELNLRIIRPYNQETARGRVLRNIIIALYLIRGRNVNDPTDERTIHVVIPIDRAGQTGIIIGSFKFIIFDKLILSVFSLNLKLLYVTVMVSVSLLAL